MKKVTKWGYKIWCRTCADDPDGCFNGSYGISDEFYLTREEAELAASAEASEWPCNTQVFSREGYVEAV